MGQDCAPSPPRPCARLASSPAGPPPQHLGRGSLARGLRCPPEVQPGWWSAVSLASRLTDCIPRDHQGGGLRDTVQAAGGHAAVTGTEPIQVEKTPDSVPRPQSCGLPECLCGAIPGGSFLPLRRQRARHSGSSCQRAPGCTRGPRTPWAAVSPWSRRGSGRNFGHSLPFPAPRRPRPALAWEPWAG